MSEKYFLNTNTHCIHIEGYCYHSEVKPYNLKYFISENEALAYDGRAAGLCKLCQRKREK